MEKEIKAQCICGKPLPKEFEEMQRELRIWMKYNHPTPEEILLFIEQQYDQRFAGVSLLDK